MDFFRDMKQNKDKVIAGFEPPKDTDILTVPVDKADKYNEILSRYEEENNNILTEKLLSGKFNTPFKNIQFIFEHLFGEEGQEKVQFKVTLTEDKNVYVTYENPNLRSDAIFSITLEYTEEEIINDLRNYIYGNTSEENSTIKFVYASYLLLLYIIETENYAVEEAVKIKSKVGKAKKGKKKKVIQTKITFKRYVPKLPTGTTYERHVEAWKVRGHYRVYKKTGKKVWVAPHVKGEKRKAKDSVPNKNYTI